jgi:uncharacterized protein (DUF1501 family)
MTRRIFLRNGAIAMAGVGAAPAWLARAAAAVEGGRRKILVVLFQRGAADGLNIVVPHADRRYYELRPMIAIPRAEVLDLNGTFGLHPALEPLKGIYDAKQLAIVEAVGSPDPTRSHFDAQDYMESGTPGVKSTRDGWLNRALTAPAPKASPVRAVALGPNLPRTLRGRNSAVALATVNDFQLRDENASTMFESLYAGDKALSTAGRDTFEAMRMLESVRKQPYTPADGAQYPNGRLGQSLRQIAQLIRSNVGLEVAFADMGGWDTHVNEVGLRPTVGPLANLLTEFGRAIAAFHRDMGSQMEDIVLVTMSEFGRTARENGNRGTDHGHANFMFLLGGGVKGGQIYGEWPGLEPEQLHDGRDLALTTDFRDVLGEVVAGHLGMKNVAQVFPGHRRRKPLALLG